MYVEWMVYFLELLVVWLRACEKLAVVFLTGLALAQQKPGYASLYLSLLCEKHLSAGGFSG